MPSNAKLAPFIAAALLLVPCASSAAERSAYGAYDATGTASWYGEELAGNRTASGERYDPAAITIAHRTLPLGSFVEITALDSGRTIIARVNDRGPGRRDRVLDLSRGAMQALGATGRSITPVRVRAVTPDPLQIAALRVARFDRTPSPAAKLPRGTGNRSYSLQIATFSSELRARSLAKALGAAVVSTGQLWRVFLGGLRGADALQRARDAVAAHGYGDVRILVED